MPHPNCALEAMPTDASALTAVLGKRAPKTKKGRLILRRREPQIVEEPKSALILAGNRATFEVKQLLRDLHRLRTPLATLFMQKHAEHPFEDLSKVERLCNKYDHGLFAFGSSSKKRPCRLILGRLFDGSLLDMQEFKVEEFKSITSFENSQKESILGSKPLVIFQGVAFENDERLKRTKSLLLDFFSGPRPEKVLLQGLEQVIVCSTFDDSASVSISRFRMLFMKSGSNRPRVELEEIGPQFKITLDRIKDPDKEQWKRAIKVPKEAKPKKVKNVTTKAMGKKRGAIHLGKQDFDQIHTVHHGHAKEKKLRTNQETKQPSTED